MADEPSAKRSSGLDDTIPASDAEGAEPAPAPGPDQRYRLGNELGRGGMGRVVEAFDTHLGRTVALKEVLPTSSASIAKRFQREVRITARLEHASIVPLYDSGVMADGRPFYVMRRVTGRPLDELIARARNLEERLALLPNVLAAIDAIGHAHRRGVIHRDLKPGNILVGELGETVVIDWGLAKVIGEEEPPPPSFEPFVPAAGDSLQTQVGSVFGTPGFMAPEQARGDELGPHSDVFALGATLYQMIAGRPPVAGTSATEVIASTLQHKIVPVTTVCPGAPPELATIIAKALAFEPDQRYPDAGALGEDVRRFLTGQLVAAHRYTRRQRLARFARRHRAALSVAALAASAVAVLSWVSVHRILKERDAATAARHEAERQRVVATDHAAKARQRADQLLIAHARGLLAESPTEAVAALKHLDASTPQVLDAAKAIAKAAVARGVAWGVKSLPGPTTSFEITRDGKRLVQVNRQGQLQVIDLELRKQIATTDIGAGNTATWVDGDRVLLVKRHKLPPAIFDPARTTIEPLGEVVLVETAKNERGDLIAYRDDHHHVGVIDIAKRTVTPVWTAGTAERSLAIAPDGSWLAFGHALDKQRSRFVVIDRDGRVLAERAGTAVAMGVSPGGKLGVSLYEEVVELKPSEARPAITKLPLESKEAQLVFHVGYRGEVIQLVAGRNLVTWTGTRILRSDPLGDTAYLATEAVDGIVVGMANDNRVHLLRDGMHHVLSLTAAPDGMYRVAAARGSSRVAATAKDAILVWDIAGMFPARVAGQPGMFITNRRVLVPEGAFSSWYIWDLDSGERIPVKSQRVAIPRHYMVDAEESRMLVVLHTQQGDAAVMVYADGRALDVVDHLGDGRISTVPGDAVVYSTGGNRIFGKVGSETSRELATLNGDVTSVVGTGKLAYAALSRTGELVTGTFAGADFRRTQVDGLDKYAFIVADPDRNVLVATGNRLLRWRGDVHDVARFTSPIDAIATTKTGIYVTLESRELYFLAATGNQTPERVPLAKLTAIVDEGRVVVGVSPSTQIEVVDMPSLAEWSLPKLATGLPNQITVSPDGSRVLQGLGADTAIWKLPTVGSDFAGWLADLTNAREDQGDVRWPWPP